MHGANRYFRGFSSLRLAKSAAMLLCAPILIAQTGSNPSRWQAQYTPIYTEGMTVGPGTGLLLGNGASIVTDPSLVIPGHGASVLLDGGQLITDPAILPLGPNTTYIVELQYRVVSNPADNDLLFVSMVPPAQPTQQHTIFMPPLIRNEPASGTFSTGAQTNSSATYGVTISAGQQVSLIVGNITIYRQDAVQTTAPPAWANLGSLPFPRLAAWSAVSPDYIPGGSSMAGIPPYYFTLEQVENGLAFADVVVGFIGQTIGSDSVRRLRQLNPKMAILSSDIGTWEEANVVSPSNNGLVDILYQFLSGIADAWYVKDSDGNYVTNAQDGAREMNVTQYAPVVSGKRYGDYLDDFLTGSMFSTGMWDGAFSDNLFGKINPHIPSGGNPLTLDAIYSANEVETPASVSDWVRSGMIGTLQNLRNTIGSTELIMGNSGPEPQVGLAPWVNGYTAECANSAWEPPGWTTPDEGAWRRVFDGYGMMQATVMRPATNVVTGCGGVYSNYIGTFVTPTADDIRRQRMILGTALLDDGFYAYGLCCQASPLIWFDEMSVDASGTAVEDRQYKGYLGNALSSATELAPCGPVLYQQDFDVSPLPSSLSASGNVYLSTDASEVITGRGSLVLSNPDHTKPGSVTVSTNPGVIQLTPGSTYLIRLDWKILETLDEQFFSPNPPNGFVLTVCGDAVCASNYSLGVVTGDSGTINLPLTVSSAASKWTVTFGIYGGGGKVAVDNLSVVQGGAGPWRRDFQNGFVLVNPLNAPHTFSAAELAGAFNRTGIHRIKGTQAPDVNNGQPVTGDLTLGAFDAIILLADPIRAPLRNRIGGSEARSGCLAGPPLRPPVQR